jgi:amino acid permease
MATDSGASSLGGSLGPTFTREGVLAGNRGRRAGTLLYAIENRSALLASRSRAAMARFETQRTVADREQAFLAALAEGRTPPRRPRIQDIERFADGWADLVPDDPVLRGALLQRIAAKYGLPRQAQRIRRVLRADDPQVRDAFAKNMEAGQLGLDELVSVRLPLRERLRWARMELGIRVEALPPFWLAYALTLTETVGGGVLALPIALAAFGPVGAIVALVFFGLVNTLTVAALVEAITRDGNMRYGTAFFGRLVGDYLGRPGNLIAMPALFALDAVGFCVALIGFGTTLAGVTGVPVVFWASALFVVALVILWRGTLDATVALAVGVGLINLALIVAISVMALGNMQPGSFDGGGRGLTLNAGLLELIFGVALVAFFGHTSAGHSAKVVLARDPSGRHLLAGNVAAMLTAMGVYVLFVIGVTGAVGSNVLSGYNGTALTPLANRLGPVVEIAGTIYITLAVGLSTLYVGLGIFNQMRELLGANVLRSRQSNRRPDHAVRFVLQASPLLVMFAIVISQSGTISFTAPLSLIGTLTLPLLGGVFPVLLLLAARRRGARLPGRDAPLIGNPIVAVAVVALFLAAVLVFGLWIWTGPVERTLAFLVSAAIIVLALLSLRRGAFRPRTVVEYRTEPGPPVVGVVSVVSNGRGLPAHIELSGADGLLASEGAETLVSTPSHLRSVRVGLPVRAARELQLWVHAITPDGGSEPTPVTVEVDAVGETKPILIAAGGVHEVLMPEEGVPATLTISLQPGIATP